MDNEELIALALAGIAVWMILVSRRAIAAPSSPQANPGFAPSWATEIANQALPGEPGWGWRFYSDGVAIDPAGAYFKNGQKVFG